MMDMLLNYTVWVCVYYGCGLSATVSVKEGVLAGKEH